MSSKIPTWEEAEASGKWDDYGSMYRDLCRMHVEAAKKEIAEKGQVSFEPGDYDGSTAYIDKESIMSAYPLNNVK